MSDGARGGPRQIGRYEILGRLADGGMAEILLARLVGPRGFEQPVVIKRMLPELARNRELVDMFVDEAGIGAAVRHPNVATVHELGRDGDELFLVLEYLEGESVGGLMRRLWTRGEWLDPRLAAHLIAEACAGLHAAHELTDAAGHKRDLVHRDVSPQNLFVTYRGEVQLLDFGIAKAAKRHTKTEAGQVKGKYGYMSPEQCYGRPLDRRSDIFSLGILLYELGTNRRLFKRDSELETLKAITEQPVVPPRQVQSDFPAALEIICLKALQRRREDRHATAAEMRRELLAFVHASGDGALPEEALGSLMQRLFPDRMADKREMLRRARSGSSVDHIPSAEADESVEIPVVLDEATAQPTRSAFSALPQPPPRRSHTKWAGLALLVLVTGGLGLALARLRAGELRSGDEPAVDESHSAIAPPIAAASTTPVATSSAEPAREISLHVVSTPAGAEIVVAGSSRGTSPGDIRVPIGTEPVVIEARLPGFEAWTQSVVPDADRNIVATLVPHRPPRATPGSVGTPHTPARPAPRARPTATTAPADPGYQKL